MLALGLVLPLAAFSCNPGGADDAARATRWVDDWSRNVRAGGLTPNRFAVPRPPRIRLPPAAEEIGRTVDQGAVDTSSGLGESYTEVKRVMCSWFGWYLETGATVPAQGQFEDLFLRYGMSYVRTSVGWRARGGIEMFRKGIERAQSEGEAARNSAAVAVCTLP